MIRSGEKHMHFLKKLATTVIVLAALPVNAAIVGPVTSLPGGATFSNLAGDPGQAGGRTYDISADNSALFTDLYYGLTDDLFVTGPGVGSGMNSTVSAMNAIIFDASTATWFGNTTILSSGSSVDTRFVATINSGGTWVDSNTAGLSDPVATPVVAQFSSPSDTLQINFIFQARDAGSMDAWEAFLPYFDANTDSTDNGLSRTSFQGGLAYTAVVPVPAAAWLFGSGLIGLVGLARRKQPKA